MNAPTQTLQSLVDVVYVGDKPMKTDNVAGTDTVWIGKGDVQPVTEQAWRRLSKHPDVWQRAETAPPEPPPVTEGKKYVLDFGEGEGLQKFVLDDMSLAELKEWGTKFKVPFTAATKDKKKLAAELYANAIKPDASGEEK